MLNKYYGMNISRKISIVIPCFNEESGLQLFHDELISCLPDSYSYEIIYVNDGSTDGTLAILRKLASADKRVHFILFTRNFGHQNALKAGFDYATGDCAISMDADLQHPPQLITQLLEKWEEGFETVNTLRIDHVNIPFLKKFTSNSFYKLMNRLSDVPIEQGVADFRLIDRKVLDQLKNLNENNIFLRGQIKWLGFRQTIVPFQAGERVAGQSKYTFRKMLKLALSGITSFSVKPLRVSIYLGLSFAILSFLYGLYALYVFAFTDAALPGWTSIVLSVLFVGGINLLMLGIIGEYLGKLFVESKRRPNYIISETDLTNSQKN